MSSWTSSSLFFPSPEGLVIDCNTKTLPAEKLLYRSTNCYEKPHGSSLMRMHVTS
jgi:hypothetical protein